MYQYIESGLDYIFLASGYELTYTKYGQGLSIKDADGLHHSIAKSITMSNQRFAGAELRYLRKHLDISQAQLAHQMGVDERKIVRWERGRSIPIPNIADTLLRYVVAVHIERRLAEVAKIVRRRSDPSTSRPTKWTFRYEHSWLHNDVTAA